MLRVVGSNQCADPMERSIPPSIAIGDGTGRAAVARALVRIIHDENQIAAIDLDLPEAPVRARTCLKPSHHMRLACAKDDDIEVLPIGCTTGVEDHRHDRTDAWKSTKVPELCLAVRQQSALRFFT